MSLVPVLQFLLIAFTLLWVFGGFLVIKNWRKLFGRDSDHENETSGARSYGITHLIVIWISGIWAGIYFAIKLNQL